MTPIIATHPVDCINLSVEDTAVFPVVETSEQAAAIKQALADLRELDPGAAAAVEALRDHATAEQWRNHLWAEQHKHLAPALTCSSLLVDASVTVEIGRTVAGYTTIDVTTAGEGPWLPFDIRRLGETLIAMADLAEAEDPVTEKTAELDALIAAGPQPGGWGYARRHQPDREAGQ